MKVANKIILFLCLLALASFAGTEKKHFLWKVSDKNSHVWLFGSIHVADSSFYPLAPVIVSAFNESRELAVEMDVSDPSVMNLVQTTMLKEGQNAGGPSIKDLASAEMWHVLDSLGTAWNFPVQAMNAFRPWFVTATLATLSITSKGLNPDYGLDMVLSAAAKKMGKPIVGLEGISQQMDALPGYGLSNEEGYVFLKQTVSGFPYTDSLMVELVDAWKSGDDVKLAKILEDESEFAGEIDKCKTEEECAREKSLLEAYEKKSIDDRNVGMAEKVEGFLKENRTVFVVVGSAHLVGRSMSVIHLLKKKGYKIERF
ncbi:MAG: TraB/GumN family protein [Fibrobacter sp.]|nr:TraB/GumN family protein [Fibrobacter sp.]